MTFAGPATRPCLSCPYRRDVPSGLWCADEYDKLPLYDRETGEQPFEMFMCHRQDGRLCAGWVGCHDMANSLALRLACSFGRLSGEEAERVLHYVSPVPLFRSGAEAAEHGRRDIEAPGRRARAMIRATLVALGTLKRMARRTGSQRRP